MISVPYEVKKALRDGMLRKNYRFIVLKDDGTEDFTIDNDTLVSESVNIDERMCSGDTLKFGLCEGSSLEFQYFNHPNITGRRVQVFVDVLYELSKWQKKAVLESVFLQNYECLEDGLYKVFISAEEASKISYAQHKHGSSVRSKDFVLFSDGHKECEIECNEGDKLYIIPYSYANTGQGEIFLYNSEKWHSIPMGFFDVVKCSRQASTGIIKATAYNKLMSDYLGAKANEAIIELASQGEGAAPDVSLYYILRELLDGYSIEEYESTRLWADIDDATLDDDAGFSDWLQDHAAQVQEIIFPLYVYSGGSYVFNNQYLHIGVFGLAMGGWQGQAAYYDRFVFNKNVAKNITQSVYNLGASDLENNYVRSNNSSPREYKSLRDFLINKDCLTFWADSSPQWTFDDQKKHVGGQIEDAYLVNQTTDYVTDIHYISSYGNLRFILPYKASITSSTASTVSMDDYKTYFRPLHHSFDWVYKSYELLMPEMAQQRITEEQAEGFGDVTLRDLQTAVYETACQFGQLSRVTDLFSGVELNYGGLYPADTLYPATDLYPGGAALSGAKSMYSQLWADEGNVHKWRYLIITYKSLDEEQNEVDLTLQRTVNADGTDDYNMSDNWLFRNLIWTAEDVGDYADAMAAKMQDVTWFPFEMWCAGLPYLETGDEIEIPLNGEVYTSYVLQRQLKGIQNLQDTYINGTLDIF